MELAALTYVGIISLILCIYMYIDKERAKKKEWRISEKTLLTLGLFGGAMGGVLGMYLFRHKTKHNKFAFGFPLMAAIHIFLLVQLF
ncbi:DUF1294 domain-containing protein [Lysinibacillus sp. 2017]|uniref:DUF1294 domain-containing protein n=1 Tax=unclassified Lysinibacillus TaxID=2636778 RepID=UPI000D5295B9|nr:MULTISPECIES: DUF1294 domain-containing protein [unclassified Lysinibacillus]AWE08295.1 DUF1294 domain-containing protein [Lysinibacillus sp. 2017]TGN35855.1 DUF1294 domain-containing protein [Lysinibacillus sp. S2017]